MLIVFTGSGKGKSTAATGQTIRAVGNGLRVAFGQFMKQPCQAGEQKILEKLLAGHFHASGPGFLCRPEERPAHRQAALKLLTWAKGRLTQQLDLLVLDETLYVLEAGLLNREELTDLIDQAAASEAHLLLTGRGLPAWLLDRSDLVTDMTLVKHPYDKGTPAMPGIEF